MDSPSIVRTILSSENAATSAATAYKVPTTDNNPYRRGVMVTNNSAANDLYIYLQNASLNGTAPATFSSTEYHVAVSPGQTATLNIGPSVSAWVLSSLGVDPATTVEFQ